MNQLPVKLSQRGTTAPLAGEQQAQRHHAGTAVEPAYQSPLRRLRQQYELQGHTHPYVQHPKRKHGWHAVRVVHELPYPTTLLKQARRVAAQAYSRKYPLPTGIERGVEFTIPDSSPKQQAAKQHPGRNASYPSASYGRKGWRWQVLRRRQHERARPVGGGRGA